MVAADQFHNYGTRVELQHAARTASRKSATVPAQGRQNRFYDTASNERSFTFLIRLYYPLDVHRDAETILRSLTDQVIAK